jgi:hypothetical protein
MFSVHHGKAHGKKKATDGAGSKRRVTVFAVRRRKKRTAISSLCRAPSLEAHGNH